MIVSGTSTAPPTGSSPRPRVLKAVHSPVAWEKTLDQLRMRLPDKPSRTVIFGRAGLRHSKMVWMRRQPDLRTSVLVKLARALKVKPSKFLDLMLEETKTDRLGEIHF